MYIYAFIYNELTFFFKSTKKNVKDNLKFKRIEKKIK